MKSCKLLNQVTQQLSNCSIVCHFSLHIRIYSLHPFQNTKYSHAKIRMQQVVRADSESSQIHLVLDKLSHRPKTRSNRMELYQTSLD